MTRRRRSVGTLIERTHGHAVARGWLRHHGGEDVTGDYTLATHDEITQAHRWLTGST